MQATTIAKSEAAEIKGEKDDVELDFILWLFLGNSELPWSWRKTDTFGKYMTPESDEDGCNTDGFDVLKTLLATVFDLEITPDTVITSVSEFLHNEYSKKPSGPEDPNYYKLKLLQYRRYYEGYNDLIVNMDTQIELMLLKNKMASQMVGSEEMQVLAKALGFSIASEDTINNMRFGYLTRVLNKFTQYKQVKQAKC